MNTWTWSEMLDADKKVREPRVFFSWTVASVPFLTSLLCIYQDIYRIISVLDGEENETHSRRIHKSGHTPSCQVLSDEPLGAVPVEAFCCIPDPWKMHCGWEGGNRECTLFSRRYTYRKPSRKKRLQATQQRTEEILLSDLSAMEISLHFRKKTAERWKLVIIFRCNNTCMDSLFHCTDTYHSFSWLLNKSSSGPFPKLTA